MSRSIIKSMIKVHTHTINIKAIIDHKRTQGVTHICHEEEDPERFFHTLKRSRSYLLHMLKAIVFGVWPTHQMMS